MTTSPSHPSSSSSSSLHPSSHPPIYSSPSLCPATVSDKITHKKDSDRIGNSLGEKKSSKFPVIDCEGDNDDDKDKIKILM